MVGLESAGTNVGADAEAMVLLESPGANAGANAEGLGGGLGGG
jgi:hypothetical protein